MDYCGQVNDKLETNAKSFEHYELKITYPTGLYLARSMMDWKIHWLDEG